MSLQFDDTEYLQKLRQLPNAQLHIHWDGSIPFEDLFNFYKKQGKEIPTPDQDLQGNPVPKIETLEQLHQFRDGLFSKYDIVDVFKIPTMAMQTAEDLKTMAIAHCQYLSRQNTFYAETRFAPWYHTQEAGRGSALTLSQVIGHALEGFELGRQNWGATVRPIICINRETSPENAEKIVRAALEFQDDGVVGIDLACYEPPFPPELFRRAYELTFDSELMRTVHADEMVSQTEGRRNLYTSLVALRANGIGHGIHLHRFPDLLELMAAWNVRHESNPISNVTCASATHITNPADLHLDKVMEAGVNVTINADDPAMWPNGDPAHNLYVVGKLYGDRFVEAVLRKAIDSAWGMSELEKEHHHQLLTKNLKAYGFRQ